jgi:uncharacterized protein YcbX
LKSGRSTSAGSETASVSASGPVNPIDWASAVRACTTRARCASTAMRSFARFTRLVYVSERGALPAAKSASARFTRSSVRMALFSSTASVRSARTTSKNRFVTEKATWSAVSSYWRDAAAEVAPALRTSWNVDQSKITCLSVAPNE